MQLAKFGSFIADDRGVSAVEYGLIVALMAAALLAGGFAVGQALNATMDEAEAGLQPPPQRD